MKYNKIDFYQAFYYLKKALTIHCDTYCHKTDGVDTVCNY